MGEVWQQRCFCLLKKEHMLSRLVGSGPPVPPLLHSKPQTWLEAVPWTAPGIHIETHLDLRRDHWTTATKIPFSTCTGSRSCRHSWGGAHPMGRHCSGANATTHR